MRYQPIPRVCGDLYATLRACVPAGSLGNCRMQRRHGRTGEQLRAEMVWLACCGSASLESSARLLEIEANLMHQLDACLCDYRCEYVRDRLAAFTTSGQGVVVVHNNTGEPTALVAIPTRIPTVDAFTPSPSPACPLHCLAFGFGWRGFSFADLGLL